MKRGIANLICAFVPGRTRRHYLRTRLMFDVKKYIEFARRDAKMPNADAKIYLGFSSTRRLIVVLDNKIAYKIPLRDSLADVPAREKLFTDAFRDASPIRLPRASVVGATIDGKKYNVLKYDFIGGTPVGKLSHETLDKYSDKIAAQLAGFLYAVGQSNPKSIAHLKPRGAKPGFMYGWTQNDIGGNFLVDEKTGKITGVIDWENAAFCDMTTDLLAAHKFLSELGGDQIIPKTIIEYGKLYSENK